MGCNCGGRRVPPLSPYSNKTTGTDDTVKWKVTTSTGTTYYPTKLEAEAAVVRAGGGRVIKVNS